MCSSRQFQRSLQCLSGLLFGIRVKVRVNVRCCAEVAVAKPILNLFERNPVPKQETCTAVSQIMESNRSHACLLQQTFKALCQCSGSQTFTKRIYTQISIIFPFPTISAQFLVPFRLFPP